MKEGQKRGKEKRLLENHLFFFAPGHRLQCCPETKMKLHHVLCVCANTCEDSLYVCIFLDRDGNLCRSFIEVLLWCRAYFLTVLLNSLFVRGISMKRGAKLTQDCGVGQTVCGMIHFLGGTLFSGKYYSKK